MAEPPEQHKAPDSPDEPKSSERVGDALRTAVERTLASTAEGAAGTRRRAQDLLDEAARRGLAAREEVSRRGGAAREEVSRRGEEASNRLAEVIADLRLADRDDLGVLSDQIHELESRLGSLERMLRRESGEETAKDPDSNPQPEPDIGPPKPHEKGDQGSDA